MRLKESLQVIVEEESSLNPFESISDSDVDDTCQPFHLVDDDYDSDEVFLYRSIEGALKIKTTACQFNVNIIRIKIVNKKAHEEVLTKSFVLLFLRLKDEIKS